MAVVTFWSNGKEQTGKTLSIVAIATYLAIEHNMKILIVSTSNDDKTLSNCYFDSQTGKKTTMGMFAPRTGETAMQSGMEGLVRIAKSNKVSAQNIKDYTKVVFRDTLEILFSGSTTQTNMSQYYPDIIKTAGQYYDMVFVDLDNNIDEAVRRTILKDSTIVVASISQRLASVNAYKEAKVTDDILSSNKVLLLTGRYDRFSRYSAKNIAKYVNEKTVLTVPYNTLFYDSAEEAQVPDMFFAYVKNKDLDKEDKNYLFFQEIIRDVEAIQYKLQELQMRM